MRVLSIQVLVLTITLTMTMRAEAQTGGHTYGDCLVGGEFSSCLTHLAKLSNGNGINYLAEVSCPGCVNGEPITDQEGNAYYPQVCPPDKTWSNPIDDNLDTPNAHYHDAGPGETGAVVTRFDERVCWRGGTCTAGPCETYETGELDLHGFPKRELRCNRSGGKIWYVIKEFGSLCDDQQYDAGYSSGPPR